MFRFCNGSNSNNRTTLWPTPTPNVFCSSTQCCTQCRTQRPQKPRVGSLARRLAGLLACRLRLRTCRLAGLCRASTVFFSWSTSACHRKVLGGDRFEGCLFTTAKKRGRSLSAFVLFDTQVAPPPRCTPLESVSRPPIHLVKNRGVKMFWCVTGVACV